MIFLRDLRYGARALMQTPVFTIVAVTALALGIGANATVFSVGNYLVLKPLPAHDPQSLTRIYSSRGSRPGLRLLWLRSTRPSPQSTRSRSGQDRNT